MVRGLWLGVWSYGLSFVFTSFLPSLLLLPSWQQNRHCLNDSFNDLHKSFKWFQSLQNML